MYFQFQSARGGKIHYAEGFFLSGARGLRFFLRARKRRVAVLKAGIMGVEGFCLICTNEDILEFTDAMYERKPEVKVLLGFVRWIRWTSWVFFLSEFCTHWSYWSSVQARSCSSSRKSDLTLNETRFFFQSLFFRESFMWLMEFYYFKQTKSVSIVSLKKSWFGFLGRLKKIYSIILFFIQFF